MVGGKRKAEGRDQAKTRRGSNPQAGSGSQKVRALLPGSSKLFGVKDFRVPAEVSWRRWWRSGERRPCQGGGTRPSLRLRERKYRRCSVLLRRHVDDVPGRAGWDVLWPAASGKAVGHQEALSPEEERVAQGRSRAGKTGRRPSRVKTSLLACSTSHTCAHQALSPVRSALFALPCSPYISLCS